MTRNAIPEIPDHVTEEELAHYVYQNDAGFWGLQTGLGSKILFAEGVEENPIPVGYAMVGCGEPGEPEVWAFEDIFHASEDVYCVLHPKDYERLKFIIARKLAPTTELKN